MPENSARWRSSWSKMECIHGQSLILCTMKSATTSAPALHLGTVILFLQKRSNQTMNPTVPLRSNFSVLATTPCRGLSLSRWTVALGTYENQTVFDGDRADRRACSHFGCLLLLADDRSAFL